MSVKNKTIELLSPAKSTESGIIAVNFGADAVYIGGPAFGARASAGNSVSDIEKLCNYAHRFHSRVYVALNTILYESELESANKLIHQLYDAGADALIIQDMGITQMDLPPIPLHVSTQGHNMDIEKIKFYESVGFQRVILARELSLEQIAAINKETNIETEVFIHGALCVSYSGQCYMSACIGNRSANRGECAQPCRLPAKVYDNNGNQILQHKHILSLNDMNRSDRLEELIAAGVTAFKIEGRLKDDNYVKTVTAHYRKSIDSILENNSQHSKLSSGVFDFQFEPDPEKVFNRGFTDYFFSERGPNMLSGVPSNRGKQIGVMIASGPGYVKIDMSEEIHNGDGLCFFSDDSNMIGFSVNKVEGDTVYHNDLIHVKAGTKFYRNYDHHYFKLLSHLENSRYIEVDLVFEETENGYALTAQTACGMYVAKHQIEIEKQEARDKEKALETINEQLKKTGNTIFKVRNFKMNVSTAPFVQVSKLNGLRRVVLDELSGMLGTAYERQQHAFAQNDKVYPIKNTGFQLNVSNSLARQFYNLHGVEHTDEAFELQNNPENKEVMAIKHCFRFLAERCQIFQNPTDDNFPATMEMGGRKFTLEYDCNECVMKIREAGEE